MIDIKGDASHDNNFLNDIFFYSGAAVLQDDSVNTCLIVNGRGQLVCVCKENSKTAFNILKNNL